MGKKGKGGKAESNPGPSSAFNNMKVASPSKWKPEGSKSPAKSAGPAGITKPGFKVNNSAASLKENKKPEASSSDSSDDSSSEEEKEVVRTPTKNNAKEASRSPVKSPPKVAKPFSPRRRPKVESEGSSTESESEEGKPQVKKEGEKKSPTKVAVPAPADDGGNKSSSSGSETDDDFVKTQKPRSAQSPPSARKNLMSALDKAKDDSSDSESSDDDSHYESPANEDYHDAAAPRKGNPQGPSRPTSKSSEGSPYDKQEYIEEGAKIVITMPNEDVSKLLERLEAVCDVLDNKSLESRTEALDWDNIAFGRYDGEMCKKVWLYLKQKRKMRRNMWDVVNQVKYTMQKDKDLKKFRREVIKNCPGYPVKPPGLQGGLNMYAHVKFAELKQKDVTVKNNYIKFYQESVKEYSNLSEKEKEIWSQKSAEVQAKYEEERKRFFANFPGYEDVAPKVKKSPASRTARFPDAPTPPANAVHHFIQSKMENLGEPPLPAEKKELEENFAKKYQELKASKQAKWIAKVIESVEEYHQAVQQYKETHPDYVEPKRKLLYSCLTKKELELWEEAQKRPKKPPSTPAEVYLQHLEESGELEGISSPAEKKRIADERFGKLSWIEKERYKLELSNLVIDYVKALGDYFKRIPKILHRILINGVEKKYRHEIEGYTPDAVESPRKRKAPTPGRSTDRSTSSKKSKKSNKASDSSNKSDRILSNVKKAKEAIETTEGSSKKKKKSKR